MLACLLAITGRSLWIDEIEIARVAAQPTLPGAWRELWAIHGSDLQMPLYAAWIWACAQIFGAGELALRAVNPLWFIPGVLAFTLACPGRATRNFIFLLAAGSPLLWYYLNEARAYSMQAGASLLVFAVLLHWWQNPESPARTEGRRVLLFAMALVLLGGSSMLCLILAATPVLAALVLLPGKRLAEFARVFWPAWLAVLGLWLLLGIYYLWTLHLGARATVLAPMGWRNVIFIGYELFGFDGLGPGRLEIRDGGLGVFRPYAAELCGYAAMLSILTCLGAQALARQLGRKKFLALTLCVLLPAGFIVAAGMALKFRVLGRHFVALSPVVFLLLAAGGLATWRRGQIGKLLVIAFFAGWLGSSLSLRSATRHEKDDYRAAAIAARAALADGRTVWWNALINGASYYQVPLAADGTTRPGARAMLNPARSTLLTAVPPDLIIASRPDVFDQAGTLADFLARSHYQLVSNLTAFTIWARPATTPMVPR